MCIYTHTHTRRQKGRNGPRLIRGGPLVRIHTQRSIRTRHPSPRALFAQRTCGEPRVYICSRRELSYAYMPWCTSVQPYMYASARVCVRTGSACFEDYSTVLLRDHPIAARARRKGFTASGAPRALPARSTSLRHSRH